MSMIVAVIAVSVGYGSWCVVGLCSVTLSLTVSIGS